MRRMILVDGIDGSGKTTLISPLRAALNYEAHVLDRFVGSNYVYDRIRRPGTRVDTALAEFEALKSLYDVRQIVVRCTPVVALARILVRDSNTFKHTLADLEAALTLFDAWAHLTRALVIDTTNLTSDDLPLQIEMIKAWL